ncbi:50S ribosomal protein L21e [Candidatus Woesearchaeota archaeon]|nr:50S ribosomal protein L21e [Candidatus Woesearchaeota archaeon]
MSARKGGARAGTRRLWRKQPRTRGKISITKYFMPYKVGDHAVLNADPAVQKSLYHQRFHGKAGVVVGKRGECYELQVIDGGKEKMLVVHPVHMKKLEGK